MRNTYTDLPYSINDAQKFTIFAYPAHIHFLEGLLAPGPLGLGPSTKSCLPGVNQPRRIVVLIVGARAVLSSTVSCSGPSPSHCYMYTPYVYVHVAAVILGAARAALSVNIGFLRPPLLIHAVDPCLAWPRIRAGRLSCTEAMQGGDMPRVLVPISESRREIRSTMMDKAVGRAQQRATTTRLEQREWTA